MKKLLSFIVITFSAASLHAQFSKANLQAAGLTCAMCSNAINKSLEKVDFVQSVKPDIKNSSFAIVFKEGTAVSIDELKDAVEDAGFSVARLTVSGQFSGVKVEKDQHIKIGNENFHFLNGNGEMLSGEHAITIVDKNYVTEKQFKKYSATTKMNCVLTGKAGSCCTKEGMAENERVYHVIM